MAKFKKGESGNPAGRPKGTPNEAGKLRAAIRGDIPEIIEALTKQAKAGDVQAAKLLIDRAIPPYKGIAPPVSLPGSHDSLTERAGAILDAAASGNLPPDTASQLIGAVSQMAKVAELDDIQRRLEALEQERVNHE